MSEVPIKTIDEFRLIDDEMFRLAAADTAFCQEIINTLTDSDIKVIKAEPQATMVNLHREIIVDVLCEDNAGKLFNCEVQVKHEHDDVRVLRVEHVDFKKYRSELAHERYFFKLTMLRDSAT